MIDVSERDVRRWLRENLSTMNTIHPKYLGTSPFKGRSVDYEFIWFFMLLFTDVSQVVQAVEEEGTVIFRDMQIRLARIMYEDFSELNTLDWSPRFKNAWLISEDEYGGTYNYAYFIQRDENTMIDEIRWGNMGWNYNMLERMLDGIRCASEPDGSCQTPLDFTYSIFCIYYYGKQYQRLNTGTLIYDDYLRRFFDGVDIGLPRASDGFGRLISWQDLVKYFKITCQRLTRPGHPALNYPGGIE
tara:strand:- start:4350 stop:5081 length:732 start_codon:yes stop_codon:yes gene_type:complete